MHLSQTDTASTTLFSVSEKVCTSETQHEIFMSKPLSTVSGLNLTQIDTATKMLIILFSELKAKNQKQHWAIW